MAPSDDSEDMGGKSTELGLRSGDYDQEVGGDENVSQIKFTKQSNYSNFLSPRWVWSEEAMQRV